MATQLSSYAKTTLAMASMRLKEMVDDPTFVDKNDNEPVVRKYAVSALSLKDVDDEFSSLPNIKFLSDQTDNFLNYLKTTKPKEAEIFTRQFAGTTNKITDHYVRRQKVAEELEEKKALLDQRYSAIIEVVGKSNANDVVKSQPIQNMLTELEKDIKKIRHDVSLVSKESNQLKTTLDKQFEHVFAQLPPSKQLEYQQETQALKRSI